jgi:hypothetical protein
MVCRRDLGLTQSRRICEGSHAILVIVGRHRLVVKSESATDACPTNSFLPSEVSLTYDTLQATLGAYWPCKASSKWRRPDGQPRWRGDAGRPQLCPPLVQRNQGPPESPLGGVSRCPCGTYTYPVSDGTCGVWSAMASPCPCVTRSESCPRNMPLSMYRVHAAPPTGPGGRLLLESVS